MAVPARRLTSALLADATCPLRTARAERRRPAAGPALCVPAFRARCLPTSPPPRWPQAAAARHYATEAPDPAGRPRRVFTKMRQESLLRRGFWVDVLMTAILFGSGGIFVWKFEGQRREKAAQELKEKNNYTVVFVLGGPGAGKGTQCEKLVKDFGFVHLCAGDLLRAEMDRRGSEYGEMIKTHIMEGKIVPMEVTNSLLRNAMKASGAQRFVIDGFPRALDQALKFEEDVCPSRAVLYYECPEQEMLARLLKRGESSGRSAIRKRFKTFTQVSMPVINYYAAMDKLLIVSCMKSPEEVYEETKRLLARVL